jgi:uncharacterized membrane protein
MFGTTLLLSHRRKSFEDPFVQRNPGLPPTYTLVMHGPERRGSGGRRLFHLREPGEPRSRGDQPLLDRAVVRQCRVDFFAGTRPNLRFSAWLLLVLGAIGAIAASVSGLGAHLAYEDDPVLASAIAVHKYTAFAATVVFAVLTVWRWRSLRQGSDLGGSTPYLALTLLGLVVLGITGFLGGNLLTEWGIGVRGITR